MSELVCVGFVLYHGSNDTKNVGSRVVPNLCNPSANLEGKFY